MFDAKDILSRLREGASAEDLAKEMADALNQASTTYAKEQEAEKLKHAVEAEKRANAYNLYQVILGYLRRYHPKVAADITNSYEGYTEDEIADEVIAGVEMIANATHIFGKLGDSHSFDIWNDDKILNDWVKKLFD